MLKRGFFKDKGTGAIRNPLPEVDSPSDGLTRDLIIETIEQCTTDGPFVFKARVAPATSCHYGLGSINPIITQIPPSSFDSYGACQCYISARTKHYLLDTPKFPSSPPDIPTARVYELRPTESNMRRGMFALQSLEVGDLILVERPMLLLCSNVALDNPSIMGVTQAILEPVFNRLSTADQEAYLALPNAHADGPTLAGIWRTNRTRINFLNVDNSDLVDSMVFREYSRINHSCEPNCSLSFDIASFSIQIRATRSILPGEEFFVSRCDPVLPTSERSVLLSAIGITCTCPSCTYNPSIPRNDSVRSCIPLRLKELEEFIAPVNSLMATIFSRPRTEEVNQKLRENCEVAQQVADTASKLMEDMKAEGLDGCAYLCTVTEARCIAVMELSLTSRCDDSMFDSAKRSELDSEVRAMSVRTVVLYRAHYGSFKKHKLEDMLGL